MIEISEFREDYLQGVTALWEEAFPSNPPWNCAARAIPAKLAVQPDLLLVAHDGGHVVGTVMAGYDGHRGWLYFVAVSRSRQRLGIGSRLMAEAERRLKAAGCIKINLQMRSGNPAALAFYDRLSFAVEERVSMGKRL